jgi:subtilisin-like proprotein convertase family protein
MKKITLQTIVLILTINFMISSVSVVSFNGSQAGTPNQEVIDKHHLLPDVGSAVSDPVPETLEVPQQSYIGTYPIAPPGANLANPNDLYYANLNYIGNNYKKLNSDGFGKSNTMITEGRDSQSIAPPTQTNSGTGGYEPLAIYSVQGIFRYQDRMQDHTGFTGAEPILPIRFADVQVYDVDTQQILASGHTNFNGYFSITINDAVIRDIAIRAITTSINFPNMLNHSVTLLPVDGGAPYTISTPTYFNHPLTNIDFTGMPVNAMSGDAGNAFHLFDCQENAEKYIENLTTALPRVNLTIYWKAGEAYGKQYDTNGHIYLMGSSADDDSYDDCVIYHEIGHYLGLSYSQDAGYYGAHSLSGNYDIRLSYSEGLGSYFMGAIRDYLGVAQPLIYIETNGVSLNWYGYSMWYNTDTPSGYSSQPAPYAMKTAENEATVGHALFDIVDNSASNDGSPGVDDDLFDLPGLQGDQLVWDVLVSIDENATSFTKKITMETFIDTFRTIHPAYNAQLMQVLVNSGIEYFDDVHENDGTSASAKPKLIGSEYHHTYFGQGDEDWSSFNLIAGTDYIFKTLDLSDWADTMLELFDTDGTSILDSNDNRAEGFKESLIRFVAPVDGTYYLKSIRHLDTPMPIGEYGKYNLTSYIVFNPKIISVVPNSGPVLGGTSVVITGQNFTAGASVLFGVYEATGVILVGNVFTVTTPANIPGLVDVTVNNPPTEDGIIPSGTIVNGFTYTGAPLAPIVRDVSPSFGSSTTTNNILVEGDYFISGASLYFNTILVSSYSVIDPKRISATLQVIPADLYDVNVTNPDLQYDVLAKGYESTLQSFNATTKIFDYYSPLTTTINIPEDFIISDLYIFVNASFPGAYPIVELESPNGTIAKVYDEIQVALNMELWRTKFSSWFGYEEAPSEGLYQYKGESTRGQWTLRLTSSSSIDSTLYSWGICFLQYTYRNISRILYTPSEYRNYLLAVDGVTGEHLYRAKLGTWPGRVAVSADQTKVYSGTFSQYNATTGDYTDSLLNCFQSFTGKKIQSIILEGKMGRQALATIPNSNKIVAITSHNLYLINTDTQAIEDSLALPVYNALEVGVAVAPDGQTAYCIPSTGTLQYIQKVDLTTMALSGQISTPGKIPRDVEISKDGGTGVIGYTTNTMDVFDPTTDIISNTINLHTWAFWISLTPDGTEAFYTPYQWYEGFGVINLTTGVGRKIMDHPESTPLGVKISDDYKSYVVDWYRGKILIYDARTELKLDEHDVMDGISLYPSGIDIGDMVGAPSLSTDVLMGGNISLSWSAPTSPGTSISHYQIYRGTSSGREVFYRSTTDDSTTFLDYNITNGQYFYRVSAVNGAGGGGLSNEAKAVSTSPIIIVDNPSAPDTIESGPVGISWTITDNDPLPNGGNVVSLYYSGNGGTSWMPIASNLNVNSDPYLWDASALPDGVNYIIKATAYDATGQTGTGISENPFSIDNIPDGRWHFQVQFTGPFRDLDMKPVELSQQVISVPVDSAGEHVIGKWEGRTYASGRDISGQWNFSVWGLISIQGLCNARLKAKIYTSSNPAPLYTSVLDNEDINAFTTYHQFYWQDAGVTGTILPGDHVQVELVLDASFGTPTNFVYNNTANDIPGNGTVTGTHVNTQVSDDTYQTIREVPGGETLLLAETFDGSFPPAGWTRYTGNPATTWQTSGGSPSGDPPDAYIYRCASDGLSSVWRLYAGPIDTSQVTALTLEWACRFDQWNGAGCFGKVQTSTDGSTWHDTSWIKPTNGPDVIGPQSLLIATGDEGSSTFYFSFTLEGEPYHMNSWSVDDVNLTGLTTSILDHKWPVVVTGSMTEVLFGIEAYVSPGEAMSMYYSTTGAGPVGGTSWNHMFDVTKTSDDDSFQTYELPVATSGTIYIGAKDINRTSGDKILDTFYVDKMFVRSKFTSPIFNFGFDYGQTQSFVEIPSSQSIYNIPVLPGWNLISFPVLASGSPLDVLDDMGGDTTWDVVKWFNPLTPADPWKTYRIGSSVNDLSNIDNTKGLWVYITNVGSDSLLMVQGAEPGITVINLHAGWNLVSYPSLAIRAANVALSGTSADKIAFYQVASPYIMDTVNLATVNMQAGRAYWVHVTADCTWTVNP